MDTHTQHTLWKKVFDYFTFLCWSFKFPATSTSLLWACEPPEKRVPADLRHAISFISSHNTVISNLLTDLCLACRTGCSSLVCSQGQQAVRSSWHHLRVLPLHLQHSVSHQVPKQSPLWFLRLKKRWLLFWPHINIFFSFLFWEGVVHLLNAKIRIWFSLRSWNATSWIQKLHYYYLFFLYDHNSVCQNALLEHTLNNSLFWCPHYTDKDAEKRQRETEQRLGPLTAFTLLAAFITGDAVHVPSIGNFTWWGTKGCVCLTAFPHNRTYLITIRAANVGTE